MSVSTGLELEREREGLRRELLEWMSEPLPEPSGHADERRFAELALRIYRYQFAANAPYRRYCDRRGQTPETVDHWRDIPAVATDAFKETALTCFPPEQAAVVFETSGTTRQIVRGKHYLRGLELYEAALAPTFATYVLPDGAHLTPVVLGFSPTVMPRSSLSHMFSAVIERFCPTAPTGDGALYFVSPAGIDIDGAIARLEACSDGGQPVLLMGTAFAFVHLVDTLTARGRRLALPPHSRIMDTGGYKGRSREVPKDELYSLYGEWLSIPDTMIVNEYGMTEMSSQFYDITLRRQFSQSDRTFGRTATMTGHASDGSIEHAAAPHSAPRAPRSKSGPPWVRTVVVDPATLLPIPDGKVGVLRHFDLANLDSVIALQTADLGVTVDDGFEIVGRAAGAEARGCSLAVEELMLAQRP